MTTINYFSQFLCFLALALWAPAASILIVTDDNTDTQSLVDDLTANGHTVTRGAFTTGIPTAAELAATDLIIVARETNSTLYDEGTEPADWNGIAIPLINMAPHLMRNNRWGYVSGTTLPSISPFSTYDSPFLNPTHPIVSGLTTTILNPSVNATGIGNSLPAAAVQIASLSNSHGIFVIPEGTTMFNNRGSAGAVRLGFIRGGSGSWDNATANAKQILENMITWSLAQSSAPPVVTNAPASAIAAITATLNGEVTDTGGLDPNVIIYYGDNNAGTNAANWDNAINLGTQTSTFSGNITGLSASTTYFFRSFASNLAGDSWAPSTSSFTTTSAANPATIVNTPATNIAFTSASLNGAVTSTGGEPPLVTIYYGTTNGGTNAANWSNATNLPAQSGAYSANIESLSANTTYFFRAAAQNSGGIAWAPSSASFSTNSFSLPAVTTSPASDITGISATANGEVTSTGGDAPSITIYFGITDGGTNPANWQNSLNAGSQSATFSTSLTDLAPLTTHFYRVFAQNSAGSTWASASQSFTTLESTALVINEFMAANDGGQSNNPNGWYPITNQVASTSEDWLEIHNLSSAAVSLNGWSLSDDPLDPRQWNFPSTTQIPGGGFLIIYASGDGIPDANGNLHTNFRLSASGENIALIRPSGTIASEFATAGTDYPAQDDDHSYGLHPITQEPVFFNEPTPGAANNFGNVPQVADTKFSLNRGYYDTEIDVTITSATPGASIYYTTDGSAPIDDSGTPSTSATLYNAPVHIDEITTLRAAATATGFTPTNIDTQSYLLLDIDGAGPNGLDPAGLNAPFLQQNQPAGYGNLTSGDYNMDTDVSLSTTTTVGHATSTARTMLLGMRDIPTISVAMNRDDFVGGNGIYTNSQEKGDLWERACSAEFIPALNGDASDWQENCGIRVQGGASRIPSRSPKHGLSFRFRAEYGEGKLREPIFPENDVEEFNVIALRAGYNNSWVHSNAAQATAGSLIRDQWMRSTMLDMGNPSAGHGLYAHLFINGLYWGIFNITERADAAHYAEHNGGDGDLLDARNGAEYVDGNNVAFNAMTSVVNSGDWTKIQEVIDIDHYIDYQLVNRYGGNSDLSAHNNWRGAGGGPFPASQPELMAPWQPYSWDGERTMESPTNGALAIDIPIDPMEVRDVLETNPEYLTRLADRVQKHFHNGGALTPQATEARWDKFATVIDRAIIAESARWGDHRRANNPYTRDNEWLAEQNRLYTQYFPVRTNNVLAYLSPLLPDTDAPAFVVDGVAQPDGIIIPVGSSLTLTSSGGTIYFTTDGTDPRLEGGAVNTTASSIASGAALPLVSSAVIKSRVLENGEWSALIEAPFILAPIADTSNIVVSEFHYNPAGTSEDTEFIELMNIHPTDTIDLSGFNFTGIGYTFPIGASLLAGERIVIVKNRDAFIAAYDTTSMNIAEGDFDSNLSNDGEELGFIDILGIDAQRFTYNDVAPWPTTADGDGHSLVLIDPASSPDHSDPTNWRASVEIGGNPGGTDATTFTGDPNADNDGDGLSALLEYAFGSTLGDAGASPESNPIGSFTSVGGVEHFTIAFRRNLGADDVTINVQISTDLENWNNLGTTLVSSTLNGDGTETVTQRSLVPLASSRKEFIRLVVTSN